MEKETGITEAGQKYAAAYAAHYTAKDLHGAFDLYKGIMTSHPGSQEAKYSRLQIQNIVKAVVPKDELFDAQSDLAVAHFAHSD